LDNRFVNPDYINSKNNLFGVYVDDRQLTTAGSTVFLARVIREATINDYEISSTECGYRLHPHSVLIAVSMAGRLLPSMTSLPYIPVYLSRTVFDALVPIFLATVFVPAVIELHSDHLT
jgi:hypothetical protein